MSNPVNVVMVGIRAAGKTSILSDMLHDVQQFISAMTANNPIFADTSVCPSIEPFGLAHGNLASARTQLENLARAARKTGNGPNVAVDMSEGQITGDRTARCTSIRFKMGRTETDINFWDFPGGFYSQNMIDRNKANGYIYWSGENVAKWEEIIRKADVILLAIDATTQLGSNPPLEDTSYYDRITRLVTESIHESMTTLVFVPVKCEYCAIDVSYDDVLGEIATPISDAKCKALRKEVETLFPELIRQIRDPEVWGNVDAFFAPMITVGGIKYSGRQYNPRTCKGEIRFSPILPAHYEKTPFHPQNCDKVLGLCLLRAYGPIVAEWKKNLTILGRVLAGFKALFGTRTPFEVFFNKFADALHFRKMVATYHVENHTDEEEDFMEWFTEDHSESGCSAMNPVYWPTSIQ